MANGKWQMAGGKWPWKKGKWKGNGIHLPFHSPFPISRWPSVRAVGGVVDSIYPRHSGSSSSEAHLPDDVVSPRRMRPLTAGVPGIPVRHLNEALAVPRARAAG